MKDETYRIKMETEGIDEAMEQIEALAEVYDGFPAQVTIKQCHNCTINVYPAQTKFQSIVKEREENDSDDT